MTTLDAARQAATCPFDHHSADFAANFRDIFDEARERGPLVWSEEHGGYWIATTHEMARRIAIDSDTFTVARSAERVGGIQIPAPPGSDTRPRFVPGEADGEEHDAYRLALNPFFSKQRVAQLQPTINRHVARALDAVIAMQSFDIAYDLVAPILSGIACELMGVEVDDPRRFFDAQLHMVSHGSDGGDEVSGEFEWAWSHIVRTVDEHRANPTDDIVSALVTHDDPPFTDEQIHMMILNISLGSNDTTKSLVAQALIYIDEQPQLRARLAADPELVRPAVDEFLRLLPVAMGPARTATRDVEIDGLLIRRNERVMLAFPSANHDPAKYPDPRSFDLDRGSAQHLGMGVGAHFCLGAWLAKAIAGTTIRELLSRCPNYAVDHANLVYGANRSSLTSLPAAPAVVGEGAA